MFRGLGFRVQGFRVWGFGLLSLVLGIEVLAPGSCFRIQTLGCMASLGGAFKAFEKYW